MKVRWLVIAPVTLALVFSCTIVAQRQIDGMRSKTFDDELLFLPSDKLLSHFTSGMADIVADMLWIKCIQYTAKHFKGDRKFTWLNHMCKMITGLDPYFVAVYHYGSIFLVACKADDDAGIDLLKKGMANNPRAWELPYEIAMTYLINRKDKPDSPVHAAYYLAMAVETGTAPPFVAELAATLQDRHDLLDVESEMWENTLKTGDKFMKELAERKLTELALRRACADLTQAATAYTAQYGHPPTSLEDLVTARLVTGLPADPLGGNFFIDAQRAVQNTTIVDERVSWALSAIRNAIENYKKKSDKYPATLQELIDKLFIDKIPAHPYAGRMWQYDPATGDVN